MTITSQPAIDLHQKSDCYFVGTLNAKFEVTHHETCNLSPEPGNDDGARQ
jgi:hypothetical protein